MFEIGSNRKEFENQGVNCICLHMSAVREMVALIYKHLFVLTYSHLCFNVGLPPSFSLTEQQHPVCYWSNIMIKDAVCSTKNCPAIQLCYPAVHCSQQVVSFLPPGRLGQVHDIPGYTFHRTLSFTQNGAVGFYTGCPRKAVPRLLEDCGKTARYSR